MASNQSAEEDKKLKELEERYKEVTDKQGFFSDRRTMAVSLDTIKAYNVLFKISPSLENIKYKNAVDLYKDGKLTYEEAQTNINTLEKTNEIATNLAANVVTSFLVTAIGLFAKGKFKTSLPKTAAIGVLAGAVIKPLFNIADRALNNIKGDEFDLKKIGKDAFFGAINGLTSGINAGFGKEFTGKSVAIKACFEGAKQLGMILWQKFTHGEKTNKPKEAEVSKEVQQV